MSKPVSSFAGVANNTNPKWWKDPGMRTGMGHIFILYTAIYSLGYDGSLLNGLQALPAWGSTFKHPAGYDLGLIAAAYYLPKIPGTFIAAYLADRFGRKFTLYTAGVLMVAGALIGTFSNTRAQLVGSRVVLGIGTIFGNLTAASLVPEIAHPRVRHMAGGFLFTTYNIGSILSAWLTFAMVYWPGTSWAWRVPTLIQGLGPAVLLIGGWWVPQSPRWLVRKGRSAEAHAILAKYHANGKLDDELVLLEMREIKTAIEIEDQLKQSTYKVFVTTSSGRRRLFVIVLIGACTQLAGNGIVSFYLAPVLRQVGITSPAQQAGINGGNQIFNWFVGMTAASLVERAGRRRLFLISLVSMLVCFSVMTGLSGSYAKTHHASVGIAVVPMLFLFTGSYNLAMGPVPSLYIPEISPLAMRAKSLAIFYCTQNSLVAFSNFVNPIALGAIAWKYYFVYIGCLSVFLVLSYFTFRETRGLTVEEAAAVYEDAETKEEVMDREGALRSVALDFDKLSKAGSIAHKEEA